ncbi:hypothetical protein M406DRAFT_358114 [Cryphonectria parasitica EP155]|uniref:Uncharacterized protein n=1 Tax=Cryphonectria parasitica (strain ATCC 38755 / EP155) TaxID=660469 RepID=A0A9P5CKA2_CRYP1|nr:uncharacterized protein M406DRAFT_358114 [Cryphonectria parasitica EP155]KAF3761838.1 hypothetical protein M406DRAFT_358114 [Cryphonectria parasitica EP155]
MQDMLDASFSALRQHFDDRLGAHRREMVELLDRSESRILDALRKEMDERCDGMQEVLEDRVREEMAEVEDNVMRNISEMPLQATLTFPQHPWY